VHGRHRWRRLVFDEHRLADDALHLVGEHARAPSALLPAAKGTTTRIGLLGKSGALRDCIGRNNSAEHCCSESGTDRVLLCRCSLRRGFSISKLRNSDPGGETNDDFRP
jgi:hypothetical protein